MNDLISRQAAIEAIMAEKIIITPELKPHYDRLGMTSRAADYNAACDKNIILLKLLPSAQQWIPVKYRPMTEEERAYWLDRLWYDGECELGDNMIFDCQMPDDEQKILVCSQCGNIWIDTHEDYGGLMGLEENGDWEDIVAWMPLPKPFKGVE